MKQNYTLPWHIICSLVCYAFSLAASTALSSEAVYQRYMQELGASFTDIIVIGGGCAGLAAGFTTAYLRHPVIVFMGNKPGGQLMGSQLVENIPGLPAVAGYHIMDILQTQAEKAGARLIYEKVIDMEYRLIDGYPLFIITTSHEDECLAEEAEKKRWCCMSVVLAMGGIPKLLHITGEQSYLNKQIFTCATCDGRTAEGKEVYVVGGGDASIDTITTLLGFGARKCTLLVRSGKLRATPALQARLHQRNPAEITILYHTQLVEIKGDGEHLHTLVLETPAGRTEVPAELVFYAIGHQPMTECPWIRRYVDCDEQGYIKVNRQQATSLSGIFAAGDVASPFYHQASYAIGCAQYAAQGAVEFCEQYLTPQLKLLMPYHLKS